MVKKTKIHELARDGLSQRKIAKTLGISRGSVIWALKHPFRSATLANDIDEGSGGSEGGSEGDGGDGIYGNRKIAAIAVTTRLDTTTLTPTTVEVIAEVKAKTVEQGGP